MSRGQLVFVVMSSIHYNEILNDQDLCSLPSRKCFTVFNMHKENILDYFPLHQDESIVIVG